jgi:hypothetical protein
MYIINSYTRTVHRGLANNRKVLNQKYQCLTIANLIAIIVCTLCNSALFQIIAIQLPEMSIIAIKLREGPFIAIDYELIYELHKLLKYPLFSEKQLLRQSSRASTHQLPQGIKTPVPREAR